MKSVSGGESPEGYTAKQEVWGLLTRGVQRDVKRAPPGSSTACGCGRAELGRERAQGFLLKDGDRMTLWSHEKPEVIEQFCLVPFTWARVGG